MHRESSLIDWFELGRTRRETPLNRLDTLRREVGGTMVSLYTHIGRVDMLHVKRAAEPRVFAGVAQRAEIIASNGRGSAVCIGYGCMHIGARQYFFTAEPRQRSIVRILPEARCQIRVSARPPKI